MKRVMGFAVALAMALPIVSWAQERPSFAGTWTLDASKSDAPPAGRGGRGGGGGRGLAALGGAPEGSVVITQTATEITIGPTTYKLDGSPSTITGGRGGTAEAKARWEGAALVIETTLNLRGNTITTKQVRRLEPAGNEMIVESTISAPMGEQKLRQVFTKSS